MTDKQQRLARAYANKWGADRTDADDPNDAAIAECMSGCAIRPRPDIFPAIRAFILADREGT